MTAVATVRIRIRRRAERNRANENPPAVGLVSCFRLPWCRCWFYSHDHLDPHFHAKASGQWELRIFFLEEPPRYEVKFAITRISSARLKELLDLARTYRLQLLNEWSEKVNAE